METVGKLFDIIDECTIVSIGYTARSEKNKDRIIEKINPIRINEVVDDNFSLKPYLRDQTINDILEDKEIVKPIILYLDAVYLRHEHMNYVFDQIKIEFLGTGNKLIVSNLLNTDVISLEANSMASILYSDLVFTLDPYQNRGKVIKSRHTKSNIYISLEGLEDYTYRS